MQKQNKFSNRARTHLKAVFIFELIGVTIWSYLHFLPNTRFSRLPEKKYSEFPKHIGVHIKRRRIDLAMLQNAVAGVFKVIEGAYNTVELNESTFEMNYTLFLVGLLLTEVSFRQCKKIVKSLFKAFISKN